MILLSVVVIAAAQQVATEKCTSEDCCLIDLPRGYCGLTLPNEPINVGAKFLINNLEEVDEAKLSYTINLR